MEGFEILVIPKNEFSILENPLTYFQTFGELKTDLDQNQIVGEKFEKCEGVCVGGLGPVFSEKQNQGVRSKKPFENWWRK